MSENAINKILRTANEYGASDIFISTGSKPSLRINGNLIIISESNEIDDITFEEYINFITNDAQKLAFKEKQDLDFSVEFEDLGRFRVNLFVQRKGPSAVLRPIPNILKSVTELGLPANIQHITNLESGLVLITGPAGSGKSTTLASMINEINSKSQKHIITVEDPIEFVHENKMSLIQQREIKSHTESFSTALKAALRENPDVILVGEMRDLETIALAITAAETGHLVFATLHTSGAPNTIDRIIDVFPPNQQSQIKTQLAMSLKAVIWQKLIKASDGQSRIPAVEILIKNNAIANLIRKGATHQIYGAMETGISEGMQTMTMALNKMIDDGIITEQQASYYLGDIIPNDDQQKNTYY